MVKGKYSLVFAFMFCLYGGSSLAQELQVDFSITVRQVKHLGVSFLETLDPFQEYAIPFLQVTVTNAYADTVQFQTRYLETPYLFYFTGVTKIYSHSSPIDLTTEITQEFITDSIASIGNSLVEADTLKVAVFNEASQRKLFRNTFYSMITQALLSYNFRSGIADSFKFIWPLSEPRNIIRIEPQTSFTFYFNLLPFLLSSTNQYVSFSVGSNNPFNDFSASQETEVVLDVLPYRKALLD